MATKWKKGRGKLGFMEPLLGKWAATAESPMGSIKCVRSFERILGSSYIRIDAEWQIGKAPQKKDSAPTKAAKPWVYEELSVIGADQDGTVRFWSYTSDGKRSEGQVADVSEIHPEAIGFVAQMPAGLARMAYWPDENGDGFYWSVEAKLKRGWKRFSSHHYRRP